MTEKQIEYICGLSQDNDARKKMLDIAVVKTGVRQFLIINKNGSFSGIPRSALYNKCIAMVDDQCFYIDGEKGLSKLTLPFQNREMPAVTKEEKAAAIAYAESHGIAMPAKLRSVFCGRPYRSEPEIVKYMTPCKNIFQAEKEKAYFAEVLKGIIKKYQDAFLYGKPLSEKDICDGIVYGYNKKILNNMAFSENIGNYPNGSPVCKLVMQAVHGLDICGARRRSLEIWIEDNATPSMDKADFRLFKAITSIKRPVYEKSPDNKTPHTFDTIRVWFGLVSKDIMPERNIFIKENKKGFARLALARIQDDRRCRIPVNLLKIDHIGITSQSQLEFIFSLKDEVTEILTGI